MSLGLAVDVVQFAALLVLAVASGVIAYSVYRIQKDRNTPKLVVNVELVEENDREYMGLYVQNVGLVPALNVQVVADIEEWREGRPVRSRFHERYDAFHDHLVTLSPQEHRLYELPAIEGWALTVQCSPPAAMDQATARILCWEMTGLRCVRSFWATKARRLSSG